MRQDGINFDKTYDILKIFERDGQNRPVVYERAKADAIPTF